jgi:AraC family transcriptional regulator
MAERQANQAGLSGTRTHTRPGLPLAENPNGVVTRLWERKWRHVSAVVSEVAFTGGFEVDRSYPFDRLLVALDEVGDRVQARGSPRAPLCGPDAPNRLYFVPAGAPFWTFAEKPRYLRYLSLQFDGADLQLLTDGASHPPTSPRYAFFDPRLLALGRLFEAECRAESGSDLLLGDGLALALSALLANVDHGQGERPHRAGLTARQVRRVTDYLDSHLSEAIGLPELARVAGLSPSHFHRAFRASMGAPPHRWLTGRRIRRAQELMLSPDIALADVAIETGFADQPHFTRAFSKTVGVSPGAWRRGIL